MNLFNADVCLMSAWKVCRHGRTGRGGRNLRGPVGGWAKGMPRNWKWIFPALSVSLSPLTGPLTVLMVGVDSTSTSTVRSSGVTSSTWAVTALRTTKRTTAVSRDLSLILTPLCWEILWKLSSSIWLYLLLCLCTLWTCQSSNSKVIWILGRLSLSTLYLGVWTKLSPKILTKTNVAPIFFLHRYILDFRPLMSKV